MGNLVEVRRLLDPARISAVSLWCVKQETITVPFPRSGPKGARHFNQSLRVNDATRMEGIIHPLATRNCPYRKFDATMNQ